MRAVSLFEKLTQHPERFAPLTALRIAEEEARRQEKPLFVLAPPETGLAARPIGAVRVLDDRIEIESQVMNALGPLSPLPPAYTELAARDRRRRAGGMIAFFELFSDRLTWLFVAAAEKYDLASRLKWTARADNMLLKALHGLLGFAADHDAMPLPGDETLRYAGLLAQRTRNAEGLRTMAEAELGLPVRLEQFRLIWRDIPEKEQARFDGSMQLGRNAMAGAKAPDRAGQCRLVVGPVRYTDFLSLEKGQPRMERLMKLVQHYIPPGIDFDVQVILDRRDIPETQLGGGALPARLGWNCWAQSVPAAKDSDEAIIRPDPIGGVHANAA
ncbi:type VI secretion system baseplate subunit TssG [Paracoccaceae bacterium GXU_MW_L88]